MAIIKNKFKIKSQIGDDFFRKFFDNANDGMVIVVLETKEIEIANQAICKMLGYRRQELEKLNVADIHPIKDLPLVIRQFERQSRGKIGENIIAENLPVKRKDGSVFYADITASRTKFGNRAYMLGIFRDITERKKTEKKLEEARNAAQNVLEDLSLEKIKLEMAEAKEEALLMSIGDGLVAVDEKGKIVLINKVAEELLGRSKRELIGLSCDEIPLFDEAGSLVRVEERPLNKVLSSGVPIKKTYTDSSYYCSRKNKTIFPIAFIVTPVIFGGKIVGAIKIFRDITREKEIDKAKSEFISLASHQLRSPTTAINWYAEMLLSNDVGTLNDKQRDYLQEIHFGNQRMIDLVNALLSVSRIEMGTFAVQPETMDITLIVDDILRELKIKISDKDLTIEQKYKVNAPINIINDPKLIRIILQNLIANAVDYTPAKGKITVMLEESKGEVKIGINDTGCGIPLRDQDKIFGKFFRSDNARMIKTDGTGLGLYITKSVTEALGGAINFKSKENAGTTFFLTIPGRGIAKKGSRNKLS